MRTILCVCIAVGMVNLVCGAEGEAKHTVRPNEGYVPDVETAIAIAVAVWNPIYGKDKIEKEKPYRATLSNGVWTVEGSLPFPGRMTGGVAVAEISKDDARIPRVSHGK